jgi:hypothetical protein
MTIIIVVLVYRSDIVTIKFLFSLLIPYGEL